MVPQEVIENKIYLIRGQKVMLDHDLAKLYGVPTGNLNRQVKRNYDRFPQDFMFQLSKQEFDNLICQFGISRLNWGGFRKSPSAFTEHGILMLSSVLKSKRAVHVNIQIMRAFVHLRRMIAGNKELATKIDILEKRVLKHDGDIRELVRDIRRLTLTKSGKARIGF